MKALLKKIERMHEGDLSEVISAVLRNYDHNHPGWEGKFLFLPKDDPDNRRCMLELWCDIFRQKDLGEKMDPAK